MTTKVVLSDLTPPDVRCSFDASCPAIFKREGGATYLIIGKKADLSLYPELAGKVGPDEGVVEVPAKLLERLPEAP